MDEARSEKDIQYPNPEIKVILQQHGKTDRTRPHKDDPEELKVKAGWLTPEGVEEAKATARQKAEEILALEKDVTFFFINSPSVWFSEGLAYGRRAEQTARISAQEIKAVIEEHNLSQEQVEIYEFVKSSLKGTKQSIQDTKPHGLLAEPDLYYVNYAPNPTGYHNALVEKYGEKWEEGFHKMEKDLEEIRKNTGAHSSEEVARDVISLMRLIERYARFYSKHHPNRLLVFWLDTHGDKMRSVLQYGLGVGKEAIGHTFVTTGSLDLQINDGVLSTNFKDKPYEVDLHSE